MSNFAWKGAHDVRKRGVRFQISPGYGQKGACDVIFPHGVKGGSPKGRTKSTGLPTTLISKVNNDQDLKTQTPGLARVAYLPAEDKIAHLGHLGRVELAHFLHTYIASLYIHT